MSKTDTYYTVPLSILRSSRNELEVLEACVAVGIVNAGIGYKNKHGADAFAALLAEAQEKARKSGALQHPPKSFDGNRDLWDCTLAGWKLLDIIGGDRERELAQWKGLQRQGEVFFRIRSDWLWNATHEARRLAGIIDGSDRAPLSFREFRILAAILSIKPNQQNFVFLGWESIQARACGFKSKVDLAAGKGALPNHCLPLSRRVIRDTLERLEALGFFVRFRYADGKRGGLMAYSFRHGNREELAGAIGTWRLERRSFENRVAANRVADRELSAAIQKRVKIQPTQGQLKEH